jgi:Orsellinic acid/F9775 biosynthesis cluster protein D
MFPYDPVHQVIICSECGTCVIPGSASQERHLGEKPHQLRGDALRTTLQLLSSYMVRTVKELKASKPRAEDKP